MRSHLDKPMALFYETPADNRRPHGSYRFDVYSLKAKRRMTLYGKSALCLFIDLEADFEVSAICERALVIPNTKPARVVDFWAMRGGVPTFFLLTKQSEAWMNEKKKFAYVDFYKWVADCNAKVVEVLVDEFEKRRVRYDNWSTILQHLISHRGQVSENLVERCTNLMPAKWRLQDFEKSISDVDAMLVRATVFTLLTEGKLRCHTIDSLPINHSTEVSRT